MNKIVLPSFFAIPMFLALALKSGVDAAFEVNAVKYLYFSLLLFGVFFLRTGRGFSRQKGLVPPSIMQPTLWIYVVVYFTFLVMVMILLNGNPQQIFKIVSPFFFFGLMLAAADKSLPFALALGAALNILGNAALLPFEYGWTYWGGIHTFKGFYLFKTDLSYSLATSLLIYAAWRRYKPTPDLLVLALLASVMVVLANSRMNYLTLALVLVFIAFKNGARPAVLAGYAAFLGVIAAVAMFIYDPSKYLGFDLDDMGSLTQGRDRIFEVLIRYGLATYGPLELLFGRGLYADFVLYAENVSDGVVHGAHNDYLFQLVSQGIFGLAMNLGGWYLLYRIAFSAGSRRWASGLAFVAFSLYFIQGMTMTVSLFALKTWPLATVLLLIFVSPDEPEDVKETGPAMNRTKPAPSWG